MTAMAGMSVRFSKERTKKLRRPKDGAQQGTKKKEHDGTDDEAEKKESKGSPKLSFNRAGVLEYSKDLEN
jgi:hypothetical protein